MPYFVYFDFDSLDFLKISSYKIYLLIFLPSLCYV